MASDDHGGERLPQDIPACYVIELPSGQLVVTQIKLVMQHSELAFAREIFDRYIVSNSGALKAIPLPDHLILERFGPQMGK